MKNLPESWVAEAGFKCRHLNLPCLAARNAHPGRRDWGHEESLNWEEGKIEGKTSPTKHSSLLTIEEMEKRKPSLQLLVLKSS